MTSAIRFKILVVEDDRRYGERLRRNLDLDGFTVHLASGGEEALGLLRRDAFDLVLSDVKMPGLSGVDLLKKIKQDGEGIDCDVPFVLLTSVDSVQVAVECLKEGAADYITKDAGRDEIVLRVRKVLDGAQLHRENARLKQELVDRSEFGEIVAVSPQMSVVLTELREIAATEANLLLTGETGVGKELVARYIHRYSPRADKPFIDVNCAALPSDNMLQSEVFGHEKGAFTGAIARKRGRLELASGGILFLDEVGDMPPESQGKILRALDTQSFERLGGEKKISVDLCVIAATNKDLKSEVEQGRFRKDLFFRLDVIHVHIPPLRERPLDVAPLAEYYLAHYAERYRRPKPVLSDEAIQVLVQAEWSGNVRELKNMMERLIIRGVPSGTITALSLRREDLAFPTAVDGAEDAGSPIRLPSGGVALDELERLAIIQALERCDWVQRDAAALLKISPDRMNARVKKFGLSHPSWRTHRQ
ncbi:MAG: sigma-54 dependent transcriptional regulator [bacterium]